MTGTIRESKICFGYNLGPRCVACCVVEAKVCKNNFFFEKEFDMFFKRENGCLTYENGIYEERRNKFFKELEETTQKFEEFEQKGLIENILKAFKTTDRYSPIGCDDKEALDLYLKIFYNKTGFVGLIGQEAGCLLRNKYKKYLHNECGSYICNLVKHSEKNPNIHSVLKEFIQKEKPDSFSYSRIIHILAHHTRLHSDLKLNIEGMSLEQLVFLKSLVRKTKGKF